ncbi:TPA: XRE family transcriptional regulator, partial [Streptococcus pneumoniae]
MRYAFLCYNGFIKIKEFAMIGKNIKSLRKTHDLTQHEFAR